MFDELDYFLSQHTSGYRKAIILEALKMCFEVQGTAVIDKVNDLLFSSNDLASDVAVQQFADFARVNINACAAEFGVVFNPDLILDENVPIFTDVVGTLLIADQYEDPHCLIALIGDAGDTEEALADVVEEITGQAADNVLDVIAAVDRDLIQKMLEENAAHVASLESKNDVEDDVAVRRSIIDRLKHSEHYNREGFVERNLVVTGLFGQDPFLILETLTPEIYEYKDMELATICYQIAIASNVLSNAVVGTAKNLVERILTEDRAPERQKIAFQLNRFPAPSVEI